MHVYAFVLISSFLRHEVLFPHRTYFTKIHKQLKKKWFCSFDFHRGSCIYKIQAKSLFTCEIPLTNLFFSFSKFIKNSLHTNWRRKIKRDYCQLLKPLATIKNNKILKNTHRKKECLCAHLNLKALFYSHAKCLSNLLTCTEPREKSGWDFLLLNSDFNMSWK